MEFTEKEYGIILDTLRVKKGREIKFLIKKIEGRHNDHWILNVHKNMIIEGCLEIEDHNGTDSYGVRIKLKKGIDYSLQASPAENAFGQFTFIINHNQHGTEYFMFELNPKDFTIKNGICENPLIKFEYGGKES